MDKGLLKIGVYVLKKYFDMGKLFGAFTPENLPTRNIRTYCEVEKMWPKYGMNLASARM